MLQKQWVAFRSKATAEYVGLLAKGFKQQYPEGIFELTSYKSFRPDDIMGFVHRLSELRTVRGDIISLRDLRYIDLETVEALEAEVVKATELVSQHCVEFLLKKSLGEEIMSPPGFYFYSQYRHTGLYPG